MRVFVLVIVQECKYILIINVCYLPRSIWCLFNEYRPLTSSPKVLESSFSQSMDTLHFMMSLLTVHDGLQGFFIHIDNPVYSFQLSFRKVDQATILRI